jgi:hypothetical protein
MQKDPPLVGSGSLLTVPERPVSTDPYQSARLTA